MLRDGSSIILNLYFLWSNLNNPHFIWSMILSSDCSPRRGQENLKQKSYHKMFWAEDLGKQRDGAVLLKTLEWILSDASGCLLAWGYWSLLVSHLRRGLGHKHWLTSWQEHNQSVYDYDDFYSHHQNIFTDTTDTIGDSGPPSPAARPSLTWR